ncbi:MAG: hypothetical protein ABRQ24_09110 [Syntrophomonadaceae bacterium]
MSSSDAKTAYVSTSVAVAASGTAMFLGSGGVGYLESMWQKLMGSQAVRLVQKQVITTSYKNLDKIIMAQEMADDLIKPGVPQSIVGKAKPVYDIVSPYIEPNVNNIKEKSGPVINRAKESAVNLKSTVEKKLHNAQVVIQEKSGQFKTYVSTQVNSARENVNQAGQSVAQWFKDRW